MGTRGRRCKKKREIAEKQNRQEIPRGSRISIRKERRGERMEW